MNHSTHISLTANIATKVAAYLGLYKIRLSVLVVFSAILGYLIASETIEWLKLVSLCIGGFLVTGASNGFNQIIEKDYDKLMTRTKNRPLPLEKISPTEAFVFCSISGILGIIILWHFLNPLSGWLGILALFMYVALYTPSKRISSISVVIGAFPGAIPPMLGWVAAKGYFDLEAGLLFALQFFWQFPHFWAIAWKANNDYKKAGFKMLPLKGLKNRSTALLILLSSITLLPIGYLPYYFGFCNEIGLFTLIILGVLMVIPSLFLFLKLKDKYALQTMFASFLYLLIAQIILFIDKV